MSANTHFEDTALTKLCPAHLMREGLCVGANCMAWRWAKPEQTKKTMCQIRGATIEPERPKNVPDSWEWVPYSKNRKPGNAVEFDYEPAHWREPKKERKGYCGLAGLP
jgi:hypothetical protein